MMLTGLYRVKFAVEHIKPFFLRHSLDADN